jgi:hypothetical protein
MEVEPEKTLLTKFVLKTKSDNLELSHKIKKAWVRVDKTTMGKKNCVDKEAYTQWVKGRISEIRMPFAIVAPTVSQQTEPDPLVTISKEEVDALKSQIAQHKEKNEEWQFKHFTDQGDIKILKKERDEKEKVIQECRKKMRDAQVREEKFKDGLASADESIKATKKRIRILEHSNSTLYDTGNQAMTLMGNGERNMKRKHKSCGKSLKSTRSLG